MKLINKFYSKVVGSTFCDGQKIITTLKPNEILQWKREPENKFDSNAILLLYNNQKIGYIPKETAKGIAEQIDSNPEITLSISVSEITGSTEKNVGCNISIKIYSQKFDDFKLNGDIANDFNDMQQNAFDTEEADIY
jgi:hypothetical protein